MRPGENLKKSAAAAALLRAQEAAERVIVKFPVLKESELEGQVARTVAYAMRMRARWENKCEGISLDELVEAHYVTKTLRPAVLPALVEVVNSVRAELNLTPEGRQFQKQQCRVAI